MKSMNELMLHFMQDIYDAEKRGIRGLAKLARAVENGELKEAILQHRDQSQTQVSRLERVFEMIGKRPRGKACGAMEGLVDEIDEAIEEGEKGPVLDAALIAGAQAVEHYEMARYGAMIAWTRTMGMDEAAGLLHETLEEERRSDQLLTEIAERALNPQAAGADAADEAGSDDAPAASAKPGRRRRAKEEAAEVAEPVETSPAEPVRRRRASAARAKEEAAEVAEPGETNPEPVRRRRAGAGRAKEDAAELEEVSPAEPSADEEPKAQRRHAGAAPRAPRAEKPKRAAAKTPTGRRGARK